MLHSLKLIVKAPENRPGPKRKLINSYSNHPFPGAMVVSGSVVAILFYSFLQMFFYIANFFGLDTRFFRLVGIETFLVSVFFPCIFLGPLISSHEVFWICRECHVGNKFLVFHLEIEVMIERKRAIHSWQGTSARIAA